MATPLLELEGTIEEIKANLPDFGGGRFHIVVTPAPALPEKSAALSIAEAFAEIMADLPEEERAKLPTDLAEQHDHYIYGLAKK